MTATPAPTPKPRRGTEIEVTIDRLDEKGRGLASFDGHPVRVAGALPGELVRVEVRGRRRGVTEGRRRETLQPSPSAIEAPCPHERACGGCSFQGLALDAQHRELQRGLQDALTAHGFELQTEPVRFGGSHWHYRNKMEFSFGSRRFVEEHEGEGVERDFALGLHAPGRFDKILDLSRCEIAFVEATPIMASSRELARSLGLTPWDVREHSGLLRHLVLRKGFGTDQIMVVLVTSADDPGVAQWFEAMQQRHPEVTTWIHALNSRAADTAIAESTRVVAGPGVIVERLAGLEFEISSSSFFQTNTAGAEELFRVVRDLAAPAGGERVHDLYCGAGTLGLGLAKKVAQVDGFEVVEAAVEDARRNAQRSGIDNATFTAGDVLQTWARERESAAPDLLILDPPRAGLHPQVLTAVAEAAVPRVIYVSCNIRTSIPQIAKLRDDAGYELRAAHPVDLFPHTPHLECVFLLERPSP